MIAGVLLAAGGASRFGTPKQLAELDGVPLLEHAIAAIEAVPAIERIVVVLGAGAEAVRAGVDFGSTEVVVCEDWETGQSASLRKGIAAIAGEALAAVITLGDMPRVTPQVIARFADVAGEHGALARARAVYDGVPGHPVVLGSAYFGAVAEIEGDVGARELLRRIGVFKIECAHLCSAIDVDTPADLEGLQRAAAPAAPAADAPAADGPPASSAAVPAPGPAPAAAAIDGSALMREVVLDRIERFLELLLERFRRYRRRSRRSLTR